MYKINRDKLLYKVPGLEAARVAFKKNQTMKEKNGLIGLHRNF